MAASEKVYVCGRCEDFGCPDLDELVNHMTNCSSPDLQHKDDTNQSEDAEMAMIEENGNNEEVHAVLHISTENESEKQHEETVISTPDSAFITQTQTTEAVQPVSPFPFLWNKKAVLVLLRLVKEYEGERNLTNFQRKKMWQRIGKEMREQYGFNVTLGQCKSKFKSLTHKYRKARNENLRRDEKMKLTCFLYDELDEFFRDDPRYNVWHDPKLHSKYDQRFKPPKPNKAYKYIGSEMEFMGKPIVTLSKGSPQNNNSNNKVQREKEPAWVKKVVESIVTCHKESMEMQREFLTVFKQMLEKM